MLPVQVDHKAKSKAMVESVEDFADSHFAEEFQAAIKASLLDSGPPSSMSFTLDSKKSNTRISTSTLSNQNLASMSSSQPANTMSCCSEIQVEMNQINNTKIITSEAGISRKQLEPSAKLSKLLRDATVRYVLRK